MTNNAERLRKPDRLAVVAAIVVCIVLAFLLIISHSPLRRKRQSPCRSNLKRIADALLNYQTPNGTYMPHHEKGPLSALSLLYPMYIDDPDVFVCPSVKKKHLPKFPEGCSLAGRPCGYAYDNEIGYRVANPNLAIGADLPTNHPMGHNVMYFNGHVYFGSTNAVSFDPLDNIWTPEPGWDPDTDSYLRQ